MLAENVTRPSNDRVQCIVHASANPKLPLHVGRSPLPSTCLILVPSRPTTPNGIQIQSAVFSQYSGQRDRQTHRPTDEVGDITCTNTRLRCVDYSDAANDV